MFHLRVANCRPGTITTAWFVFGFGRSGTRMVVLTIFGISLFLQQLFFIKVKVNFCLSYSWNSLWEICFIGLDKLSTASIRVTIIIANNRVKHLDLVQLKDIFDEALLETDVFLPMMFYIWHYYSPLFTYTHIGPPA